MLNVFVQRQLLCGSWLMKLDGSLCLRQGRNKSCGLHAETQRVRLAIRSLSVCLSSCSCGGSAEGLHIMLAEVGEFSNSYLADLYEGWGLVRSRYRISCTQAVT
jgi:hypothetical protein